MKEKKMLRKPLPISEYQKRFFLEWVLAPRDTTYNTSLVNRITGCLDESALRRACEVLIKRNELAHAQYSGDGSICRHGGYEISDFYRESVLDPDQSVESQLRAVLEIPFDLTKDVLLRLHLIKNYEATTPEYYFVICAHHIIADAISAYQITKQIQSIYNSLTNGSAVSQECDDSFTRAVNAGQQALGDEYKSKAQKFWLNFIDNSLTQPSLPYRPGIDPINFDDRLSDKTGEFAYFELDSTQTTQLKAYARQNRTTVFIALSAIYGLVLSKYCNQKKIVLSYPINMRPQGFSEVTGCFVNNLPLILDFGSGATVKDVLKSLGEQRKEVKPYQGYSLVDITQDQRKHKSNDFSRILKIGFVQANLNTTVLDLGGVGVLPVDISASEKVDFEIALLYDEYSSSSIKFKFSYRKALFDKGVMHQFINSFKSSILEVIGSGETLINSFSVLSPAEYDQVVYQWNETDRDYPKDKTIHQLFQEQVERTPENIAIAFEGHTLTYQQLNERSNQLARYIQKSYREKTGQELKADTLIALYLDRSLEMIIGILATLKAGGAYVPMDTNYPQERVAHILSDTAAELVLSQGSLKDHSKAHLPEDRVIYIDLAEELYKTEAVANLPASSTQDDLAYVIYTSGTTGKPKGVMIAHSSVANYNTWMLSHPHFASSRITDCSSSISFDATVNVLLTPLCCGQQVVLCGEETKFNIDLYYDHLRHNRIELIKLTPSYFSLFLGKAKEVQGIGHLKCIIIGGEKANKKEVEEFTQQFPSIKIIHHYGPTETTVGTTSFIDFDNHELLDGLDSIPLGKVTTNNKAFILDSLRKPVPIGVIGELYISGAGVARGYLKRPELTAERFVPNPFATAGDRARGYDRLYKTGDLVRWLPDGNIEYLGRNDDQVKIRGFRIELGEIEQAILQVPGIKQSCVLVKERKTEAGVTKHLVGYYVLEAGCEIGQPDIIGKLAGMLPEYMIPASLVEMDSFPLTTNGKLDKKALPEPDLAPPSESYTAPQTDMETRLSSIWGELLGLERVGATDDFFRIGGDSILAIRLVSAVNVKFGTQISVKDIFTHSTISKLSAVIQKSLGSFKYQDYWITTGFLDENKAFGLSNVQQAYRYGRLENFEMGNVSTHGYSEMLFSQIDHKKIEAAINKLIQRHGALRTIFKGESQYILQDVPYYRIHNNGNIDQTSLEVIRNRLSHKVCEIDRWPLFDIEVSALEGHAILHFSVDALIMDGASKGILSNELALLYNSEDVEQVILPELRINFRDYMMKYAEVRSSELYTRAEQYWVSKLSAYSFDSQLPMVVNPASISQPRFARITRIIPQPQWQSLEEKSKRYNIGITSVVLYAYGQILSKWSGQPKFCVNLTLFNRLPIHEQVNDILGDFTVLELFNFERRVNERILTSIQEVHEDLWNDIEHNLFDGIDFQRLIRKERGVPQTQTVSPVVLTSMLGNSGIDLSFSGYIGAGYSITQTPQVYIDNKAYQIREGFVAEWDYVEQLFDPEIIKQMHTDYCRLIEYLAEADWEGSLPEIELWEQDQTVIEGANNHYQEEVTRTLVDICLSGIVQNPDKTAIIDPKGAYTYSQVGEYSYRIAGYLHDHGLSKPNHLIGVLSEKGYQQVVSTIGIMQSGAAYLPLHVDWPHGRIDEILEEGMVKAVMVSRSEYNERIKGCEIEPKYEWLVIEEIVNYQSKSKEEQLYKASLDDIAYVIFTSGSTGKPKGVTISHKGAVNTILAVNDKFNVGKEDKVLALSELSFDLSVYDIFGLMAAGGTIVFPTQERTKEPSHWYGLIEEHGVTVWDTVPQLMQLLVDYVNDTNQALNTLRVVLMSGDWIPVKLPSQIKALSQGATVMSLGGATEGSIWSIWYDVQEVDPGWTSIPYGQAMPNQKMYVLNEFKEHCPVGVTGDIYIGGQGIALGYWNDEAKTRNSFMQHKSLGRLYKTGDLGKWNRSGYIEFGGRNDNQIKLNGYRVELDEISSKLSRIKGIDKALVTIQENQLIAYLVPDKSKEQQGSAYIEEQSQGKIILDKKDRELFRFEQRGVRKDLLPVYELKGLDLNEEQYRLRKSYRQFEVGSISLTKEELSTFIATGLSKYQEERGNSGPEISGGSIIEILRKVLKPLSAIKLEDKALPKYLYPSGGSTNPIQCYVDIAKDSEEGEPKRGCYYYEPVSHYLAEVEDEQIKTTSPKGKNDSHTNAPIILKFKLYYPAIEPLYGDMAIRLAWLEMGHILALLEKQLVDTSLKGELVVADRKEGDYHHFIELAININKTSEKAPIQPIIHQKGISKPDIDYLRKDSQGFSDQGGRQYNLANLDLFTRVSELGQLLECAQGLIVFKGSNEPEALMKSGYQAQWLTDQLYQKDIGSCLLGFVPYENSNYSMIVGPISKGQKALPEIQVKKVSLEGYINQQIEQYLPQYMLPNCYLILEELPLTANGKVDYKKLPKVEIVQSEYFAPTTGIEIEICEIWKEILGVDKVGITDDFFMIGGNSILAIQVSHQMSKALGCDVKVTDFFKLRTIKDLLENVSLMKVGYDNIQIEF